MNHQQDKKWSAKVTQQSNALALDEGVFTWKDPLQIAISLKHSAEKSQRRKSSSFRSATSMLVFILIERERSWNLNKNRF